MEVSPFATALQGFQDEEGCVALEAAEQGSFSPQEPCSKSCDVAELLAQISLLAPLPPPALARTGSGGGPRAITDANHRLVNWVQPSGPRCKGQGVEDVEQGVVMAEPTPTGGALLRITLLAAGFIIGPAGTSVRDVCQATGTDIKSWTADPDQRCTRSCRVFRVEGPRQGVARAVSILCDAVARYKELCEGQYAGQSVARIQHIGGVDFSYQPPPRSIVPYAASLRGQSSGRRNSSKSAPGGCGSRPPAAPRQQQNDHKATGSLSAAASLSAPFGEAGRHPSAAPSRSASLPQEIPFPLDSASASRHGSCSADSEPRSAGSSPSKSREAADPSGSPSGSSFSSRGPSRASSSGKLKRAASLPAHGHKEQHLAAPAPTAKLAKDDVLRSVFGVREGSTPAAVGAVAMLPAQQQISLLLQQLALRDAQQQAAVSAALANQQGLPGGYNVADQGLLPPAPLSSLACTWQGLAELSHCGAVRDREALMAAQHLASNADVLAAVAGAWQSSEVQQAAASEQLLKLAAAGLLGPAVGAPPAPGSGGMGEMGGALLPAAFQKLVAAPSGTSDIARRSHNRGSLDDSPSQGGTPPAVQEQHMPLSAFQPVPEFAPRGSVGRPPTPGSHSCTPSPAESSVIASHQLAFGQQDPGTPRQRQPDAAHIATPPCPADAGTMTSPFAAHASPSLSATFGGSSPAADTCSPPVGAATSSHNTSPTGSGIVAAGEAPGAAGEHHSHLSPFATPFQPACSAAPASRAASMPGALDAEGHMARLADLIALARSNSYTTPPDQRAKPSSGDVATATAAAAAGTAEPGAVGGGPRGFGAHGSSLFASAFSPRGPGSLPQAPSLPITTRLVPERPPARSTSRGIPLTSSQVELFSEVDRVVEAMF